MRVTPQKTNGRRSAIDWRTTRHGGYAVGQRVRKRIEEAFGWIKTVAGQEKTKLRGRDRVGWTLTFAAAAYIWCGCRSSWRCRHGRPRAANGPLADHRSRSGIAAT
ncbi:hypothetical protein X744_29875 [Mesorhizobium sp. LNJC372A00]|nr:hypothetical protein X745_30710 [Mesorhizobium sp. LNJC374B00]ESY52320.1 hypothetical protein X744_29875 [Mesorhizobium sp. LNJC372A00]